MGVVSRYVSAGLYGASRMLNSVSCGVAGQDNTSNQCIVGDVPNIFEGDEGDHDGPYDGVEMGC